MTAPASPHYKGFWIRYLAFLLDGLIVGLLMWTIILLTHTPTPDPQAPPLVVLLFVAYFTVFHGHFGATPGKMAIHAKVVAPDGSPIGYGKAFARALAFILSYAILCIGFIIAGFDDQKRTLHDRICATRVVAR